MEMEQREPYRLDQGSATQQIMPVADGSSIFLRNFGEYTAL